MKKYVLNNKKVRIVALAVALGGAPLLSSLQLKADQVDEYRVKTEQEHKFLVEIVSEFGQYGDALKGFTNVFFRVDKTLEPSKEMFLNLTKNLLEKINGIKAKCTQHKESMQTEENKRLLIHLEELATLLANSQTTLHKALEKALGTPSLTTILTVVAQAEEKQISKIDTLRKIIDKLLKAHDEQQLKQQFDSFVKSIEYSLSFPKKNQQIAFAAAVRYKKLN